MNESYLRKIIRKEIAILSEEVTRSDLAQLEKYLDRLFSKLKVDIEFTNHFFDRVNDPRNKKPITPPEIIKIFRQAYKKHGKKISNFNKGAQAVLMDMSTDINVPFVIDWDKNTKELDLISKTIMRKKNFGTSNLKLKV